MVGSRKTSLGCLTGKPPTLRTAAGGGHIPSVFTKGIYKESGVILKNRLLTPLECERLQTVAEGYTEGVSKTQRYRMLGNGWTVDVIVGLLQSLKSNLNRSEGSV